jgi:hypothetical protein
MNRNLLITLGVALAPGLALADGANLCRVQSGAQTGALIELYTSEGCSSCPPADHWFSQIAASADPQTTSLLAFHVDYWDELGWPDRFARHAYTQRQSSRVRAAGSTTIYTPQVMLSSTLGLHWYQPEAVTAALSQDQRQPAKVRIELGARPEDSHWRVTLRATPAVAISGNADLYLALYEDGLVSQVKAGENNGATLRHDRVVRGFWGPWRLGATGAAQDLRVTLPVDARVAHSGVTAFVQDSRNGETLQALSLPLGTCGK